MRVANAVGGANPTGARRGQSASEMLGFQSLVVVGIIQRARSHRPWCYLIIQIYAGNTYMSLLKYVPLPPHFNIIFCNSNIIFYHE